jgi:hypothetical protein
MIYYYIVIIHNNKIYIYFINSVKLIKIKYIYILEIAQNQ